MEYLDEARAGSRCMENLSLYAGKIKSSLLFRILMDCIHAEIDRHHGGEALPLMPWEIVNVREQDCYFPGDYTG